MRERLFLEGDCPTRCANVDGWGWSQEELYTPPKRVEHEGGDTHTHTHTENEKENERNTSLRGNSSLPLYFMPHGRVYIAHNVTVTNQECAKRQVL